MNFTILRPNIPTAWPNIFSRRDWNRHLYEKARQIGLAAHRALGCNGYSRVDLLVTDAGDCYVLEVNTLPGMTALCLLPEIAAKGAGLSFNELVSRIIESASLSIKAS